MAMTPTRRTIGSARDVAEAAFKSATAKPAAMPEAMPAPKTATTTAGNTLSAKAPSLPNAREMVSLRLDRDVLEHFQQDGPGWQDRLNAALRKAAGL